MTNTKRCRAFLLGALCLALVPPTFAQTPTQTASALPRLVRFGGTAKDAGGAPLSGVAGITFSLYAEQTGGAPLWQETQNVTADSSGRYSALLGATKYCARTRVTCSGGACGGSGCGGVAPCGGVVVCV